MTQNSVPLDSFDIAFQRIIFTLQEMGYIANEAKLGKKIGLPDRAVYKFKKGLVSIPVKHRDKILAYFIKYFDANPKYFSNLEEKMFKHDSPRIITEPPLLYEKSKATKMTAGEWTHYKKLIDENKHLQEKVTYLEKLVKSLESQVKKG